MTAQKLAQEKEIIDKFNRLCRLVRRAAHGGGAARVDAGADQAYRAAGANGAADRRADGKRTLLVRLQASSSMVGAPGRRRDDAATARSVFPTRRGRRRRGPSRPPPLATVGSRAAAPPPRPRGPAAAV